MNGAMDERSSVWPVDELRTNPKVSAAACVRTSRDYVCHNCAARRVDLRRLVQLCAISPGRSSLALWLEGDEKIPRSLFFHSRPRIVGRQIL